MECLQLGAEIEKIENTIKDNKDNFNIQIANDNSDGKLLW